MTPCEKTVLTLLSSYRTIPAMYSVLHADGHVYYAAVTQLSKILCVEVQEVRSFLLPFKARIIYAMQDFRHYVELLRDVPTFEEAYWLSMDEEAKLITNNEPFRIPLEAPDILDIGCGSAPYIDKFNAMCDRPMHYTMVDKRKDIMKRDLITGVYYHFYPMTCRDYLEGLKETESMREDEYNVLFLANFLHCVEDVHGFFGSFIPAIPTLRFIKIIEIKPSSSMNLLFDYHMLVHCRGQAVDEEILSDIKTLYGKKMITQSLGEHHNMYTIVL